MAKTVLKITGNSAAVKCAGAGTYTITLNSDLLKSSESLTAGGTPTVNIQKVIWCGAAASSINITRNAISVMDINSATAGAVDFTGAELNDNIANTSDIVVTITGAAQCWLTLRKITGYSTKFEPEQFGPYDNTTLVGS